MNYRMTRACAALLAATIIGTAAAQTSPSLADFARTVGRRQATEKANALAFAKAKGIAPRVVTALGRTYELIAIRRDRPVFLATQGLTSAETVDATQLWPGGTSGLSLTGQGLNLGIWDGGKVDGTHAELTGRVSVGDSVSSVGTHATFVGGVMIATGIDPNAIGIANGATLTSFDWNNDVSEMAAAAAGGMRLSNHSYGISCGWVNNLRGDGLWAWLGDPTISTAQDWQFGFYDQTAHDLDEAVRVAGTYLPVFASANNRLNGPSSQPVTHWEWSDSTGTWVKSTETRPLDGGTTGYDTLPLGYQNAKNDLVVGAVKTISTGYQSPSDVVLASFSSCGPTDDGRIKPDVVAPGVGIYSTEPNNTYASGSGTSYAAPAAVGSLALLEQEYKNSHRSATPLSATIRALAIHTADQATSTAGPSYQFGWGLLDAKAAATLIASDGLSHSNIFETSLSSGGVYSKTVTATGTQPLKVTIAWNDPGATPLSPAYNNRTPRLVNDLDLRVTLNNQTYMPWVLNPDSPSAAATQADNSRDNVEQVLIPAPTAGSYTITVRAKNATLAPSGSQPFSLVVTGNRSLTPSVPGFVGQYGDGTIAFWKMSGNKVVSWNEIGNPGSGYVIRGIGDTDGDGQADMIGQLPTGPIAIWRMSGDSVIGWQSIGSPGPNIVIRAVADFDGDGKADLLGQNTVTGDMAIWYMNGFSVKGWADIGVPGAAVIGAGDFDGDGKPDVLAKYADGGLAIWFMNNNHVVNWKPLGSPGSSTNIFGVSDFDGNGHADFIGQSTSSRIIAIWFGNGSGGVANWQEVGDPGPTVTVRCAGMFSN